MQGLPVFASDSFSIVKIERRLNSFDTDGWC